MYKQGIDYFPLDVHLDDKWKLLEARFGLKGFAIVVKLLQKIYGEQGYYCEANDDMVLLFARECGVNGSIVTDIIQECCKRGIFDSKLYEEHTVLTSRGIQKRYCETVRRRKNVSVETKYLYDDYTHLFENVDKNQENVNKNQENASNSQQRKEEKRREEERKEKESNKETSPPNFTPPTLEEVISFCNSRNSTVDGNYFWHWYKAKNWDGVKDWKERVLLWELKDYKQKQTDNKPANSCNNMYKVLEEAFNE